MQTKVKYLRPPRYLKLDDALFTRKFPEPLLVMALANSDAEKRITLNQLGLEEEDVIIREHNKVYFYFRRKRK